jgi:hypothetical protein
MYRRLPFFLAAVGLALAGCGEEDRSQAEAGANWLGEKRLFRPFGKIGEITKVTVESAELIRMHVAISEKRSAEAIDAQSLMLQSMIAKHACPGKKSGLWPILGKEIMLRVDLKIGEEIIASGICQGP